MDTELLNGKDLTKYMWGCDGSGIKKTLMEWLENLRGVIVLTGGCDWNWRQLSSTHIRDGLRVTVWSLEASQHPNKRGGAVNLDQFNWADLKGPRVRQQQHIPAKNSETEPDVYFQRCWTVLTHNCHDLENRSQRQDITALSGWKGWKPSSPLRYHLGKEQRKEGWSWWEYLQVGDWHELKERGSYIIGKFCKPPWLSIGQGLLKKIRWL